MKAAVINSLFLGGACILLSISAHAQRAMPQVEVERRADRSYQIGQEHEVFVGEPIVRLKDYFVQKTATAVMYPDKDFSFRMLFKYEVAAQTPLPIVETTEIDGVTYRAVRFPQPALGLVKFFVDSDGRFLNTARTHINQKPKVKFEPQDVTLRPGTLTTTDSSKGHRNLELVYGGVSGDEIRVAYREYTQDDLAKPAFSQELVYSLKAKKIRYRDIDIEVLSANNEKIRYRVIADGLPMTSTSTSAPE